LTIFEINIWSNYLVLSAADAARELGNYYLDLFLKDHKLTAKFNHRKRGKITTNAIATFN
jgi:hypothetical protein